MQIHLSEVISVLIQWVGRGSHTAEENRWLLLIINEISNRCLTKCFVWFELILISCMHTTSIIIFSNSQIVHLSTHFVYAMSLASRIKILVTVNVFLELLLFPENSESNLAFNYNTYIGSSLHAFFWSFHSADVLSCVLCAKKQDINCQKPVIMPIMDPQITIIFFSAFT